MKKGIIAVLILLLPIGLFADTPKRYKTLQFSLIALDYVDICSTYHKISYDLREVSPLVRWYIKSPTMTVYVHVALNFAVIKISNMLYKKNKTVGWIALITLTVAKSYIIYRNIKEISEL